MTPKITQLWVDYFDNLGFDIIVAPTTAITARAIDASEPYSEINSRVEVGMSLIHAREHVYPICTFAVAKCLPAIAERPVGSVQEIKSQGSALASTERYMLCQRSGGIMEALPLQC